MHQIADINGEFLRRPWRVGPTGAAETIFFGGRVRARCKQHANAITPAIL